MAIPLLLQVGAVPFVTGQDSLAARRQHQRAAAAASTVTLTSHQRAVIGELMSEAAQAIKDVLRQPQTSSICINTDLTVPPNTPNLTTSTFEFPEPPAAMSSSSSDENELGTPKRPQRKLKRKRVQSFKKHRVSPKKQTTSDEADDEASDNEESLEELKLKLDLISESQIAAVTSSPSDAESEEEDDAKKWAQVGEELRFIADRFGSPDEDSAEIDFSNPFKASDLVSLMNLMLPVSVPQSLWSALLSYAAWKIFKRFQ